jgi:hypothetical protein
MSFISGKDTDMWPSDQNETEPYPWWGRLIQIIVVLLLFGGIFFSIRAAILVAQ